MKLSSAESNFIAIDLGASGGRVLVATLRDERLTLREIRRFEHRSEMIDGLLSWDIRRIWREIKLGIAAAAKACPQIDSIAIDSWAVDYGLLDARGQLLRPPAAYRDPRTQSTFPRVVDQLGRENIYARTGIQFIPINTLYQLAAEESFERAETMLMIPQLIGYWLCGAKVAEHTNASSTQLYDSQSRQWVTEFADAIGLPREILPPVVDSNTVLGTLLPEVAGEVGLPEGTPVIAGTSHDTASAIVGTPLAGRSCAYLSSGTWSLLGVELPSPLRSPEALAANLTNEAGAFSTTRLLKNVTGMWLVQECRRVWAEMGREHSYEQLTQWAGEAPGSRSLIDPNDPQFSSPGNYPALVKVMTGYAAPGQIVRCIFDSLAASYAKVLGQIERVAGRPIDTLHVVGGGAQIELLNRLTASATSRRVVAGPVEATAIGNALMQAITLGFVEDLAGAREIVRSSFDLKVIDPK